MKSADLIKNQVEETLKTTEDFAERNATRSGLYLKAHTDLYEKHLKEKLQILIEAIFEQIDERDIISKDDEENIIDTLKKFIDRECENKKTNLKELMASTGQHQSGIGSAQMATIVSHFNEEKNIKIDYIKYLVEKHNIKASEKKKNRSFWQTKNGTITAIGTSILAITSIIAILNSFSVFSKKDDYLNIMPIINKYELSKEEIRIGDTIQIQWDVINVDSVIIDSGIGKVSFSGIKSICPNVTSTFTLSAYLDNIVLSFSKTVFVYDSLGNSL